MRKRTVNPPTKPKKKDTSINIFPDEIAPKNKNNNTSNHSTHSSHSTHSNKIAQNEKIFKIPISRSSDILDSDVSMANIFDFTFNKQFDKDFDKQFNKEFDKEFNHFPTYTNSKQKKSELYAKYLDTKQSSQSIPVSKSVTKDIPISKSITKDIPVSKSVTKDIPVSKPVTKTVAKDNELVPLLSKSVPKDNESVPLLGKQVTRDDNPLLSLISGMSTKTMPKDSKTMLSGSLKDAKLSVPREPKMHINFDAFDDTDEKCGIKTLLNSQGKITYPFHNPVTSPKLTLDQNISKTAINNISKQQNIMYKKLQEIKLNNATIQSNIKMAQNDIIPTSKETLTNIIIADSKESQPNIIIDDTKKTLSNIIVDDSKEIHDTKKTLTNRSIDNTKETLTNIMAEDDAKKTLTNIISDDDAKKSLTTIMPDDDAKETPTNIIPDDDAKKSLTTIMPNDNISLCISQNNPEAVPVNIKCVFCGDYQDKKVDIVSNKPVLPAIIVSSIETVVEDNIKNDLVRFDNEKKIDIKNHDIDIVNMNNNIVSNSMLNNETSGEEERIQITPIDVIDNIILNDNNECIESEINKSYLKETNDIMINSVNRRNNMLRSRMYESMASPVQIRPSPLAASTISAVPTIATRSKINFEPVEEKNDGDNNWKSLSVDMIMTSFKVIADLPDGAKLKIVNGTHLAKEDSYVACLSRYSEGQGRDKIISFLDHLFLESERNIYEILDNIRNGNNVDTNVSVLNGVISKIHIFLHRYEKMRNVYIQDSSAFARLGIIRDKFFTFLNTLFRNMVIPKK